MTFPSLQIWHTVMSPLGDMIVTALQAAYAPQLDKAKVIPITNILSMIEIPHRLYYVFLMLCES